MSYKFLPLLFLGLIFLKPNVKNTTTNHFYNKESVKASTKNTIALNNESMSFEMIANQVYSELNEGNYNLPSLTAFTHALEGYEQLKALGKVKNELLTVIDFSLSSKKERMWVIDMTTKTVILQSLVSHGMNSGEEFANQFSNSNESHKSSLGFYITGETYIGKHGYSLKIDGQEYGINNNARERSVVVHAADYVSHNFAKSHGFIGRSHGCPAVPNSINKKLIDLIKGKSVLYIFHSSRIKFNTQSVCV